jgi:hypothetical protein
MAQATRTKKNKVLHELVGFIDVIVGHGSEIEMQVPERRLVHLEIPRV